MQSLPGRKPDPPAEISPTTDAIANNLSKKTSSSIYGGRSWDEGSQEEEGSREENQCFQSWIYYKDLDSSKACSLLGDDVSSFLQSVKDDDPKKMASHLSLAVSCLDYAKSINDQKRKTMSHAATREAGKDWYASIAGSAYWNDHDRCLNFHWSKQIIL